MSIATMEFEVFMLVFLQEKGFNNLLNLEGGIDAWSLQIDEKVPRY